MTWNDTQGETLSQRVRCETSVHQRTARQACSELRVVRVRVRDGVLVIHRSVLKRDVVMREGVRNAVAIIVYRKCS